MAFGNSRAKLDWRRTLFPVTPFRSHIGDRFPRDDTPRQFRHSAVQFSPTLSLAWVWGAVGRCWTGAVDTGSPLYYSAVVMSSERLLGGFETLLLLAVIRLDNCAYGVTVREELKRVAGKDVAVGAIYTGLDRLEQKGFVESWYGDPTPERGGRAKRFYRATARGIRAIKETQYAIRKLSSGLKMEKLIWST